MKTELKKKHRNRVWLDSDGDVWFWNSGLNAWNVLCAGAGGYSNDDDLEMDPKGWGVTFKRIAKLPKS